MGIEAKHAYRFNYLKSEEWSTVRTEALVRENAICELCGTQSTLNDAHHIWYPESVWDTQSIHLAVMCRECHQLAHSLLPNCKTNDQAIGLTQWFNLKNALHVWMAIKMPRPQADEPGGIKQLRIQYRNLCKEFKNRSSMLSAYQDKFGMDIFSSKPVDNKARPS